MKRKTRLKVAVIKSLFVAIENFKSLCGGDCIYTYSLEGYEESFFDFRLREDSRSLFNSGFSIKIFTDCRHNYYAESFFYTSPSNTTWYEAGDDWNRKNVVKIFNLDYYEIENICLEFKDDWMYDSEKIDSVESVINNLSIDETVKLTKLIKGDIKFDSFIKKLLLTKGNAERRNNEHDVEFFVYHL